MDPAFRETRQHTVFRWLQAIERQRGTQELLNVLMNVVLNDNRAGADLRRLYSSMDRPNPATAILKENGSAGLMRILINSASRYPAVEILIDISYSVCDPDPIFLQHGVPSNPQAIMGARPEASGTRTPMRNAGQAGTVQRPQASRPVAPLRLEMAAQPGSAHLPRQAPGPQAPGTPQGTHNNAMSGHFLNSPYGAGPQTPGHHRFAPGTAQTVRGSPQVAGSQAYGDPFSMGSYLQSANVPSSPLVGMGSAPIARPHPGYGSPSPYENNSQSAMNPPRVAGRGAAGAAQGFSNNALFATGPPPVTRTDPEPGNTLPFANNTRPGMNTPHVSGPQPSGATSSLGAPGQPSTNSPHVSGPQAPENPLPIEDAVESGNVAVKSENVDSESSNVSVKSENAGIESGNLAAESGNVAVKSEDVDSESGNVSVKSVNVGVESGDIAESQAS
ncbi:hypothetical protein F4778DRAFT_781192 [Xylariomycetidae sp. FL2044]|nr:hypothetical protein F4778DRAFT_781192 [Xylariomycetidae sp. FL2044]